MARGESRACPLCATPHHPECWEFLGRCSVYGCRAVHRPVRLEELIFPVAPRRRFGPAFLLASVGAGFTLGHLYIWATRPECTEAWRWLFASFLLTVCAWLVHLDRGPRRRILFDRARGRVRIQARRQDYFRDERVIAALDVQRIEVVWQGNGRRALLRLHGGDAIVLEDFPHDEMRTRKVRLRQAARVVGKEVLVRRSLLQLDRRAA